MRKKTESASATPFVDLVRASARIGSTRSRLEKKRLCVDLLAAVRDDEIAAAVGWLVEKPICGPLGVGPAAFWELSRTPAPRAPTLTLAEVERALGEARIGGRDEACARVGALFENLTDAERAFVSAALTGTLRQGSLGGVMLLALVDLSGEDENSVRRAVMVTGSIPRASEVLLGDGRASTPPSALQLFHPLSPMLAASAESLEDAMSVHPNTQVEWKVDGVRAQVHLQENRISVYSRQGNDITAGCAPLLAQLSVLEAKVAVLDGELFLASPEGVARPFQDSFSALSSTTQSRLYDEDRLCLYLFDCMHKDGRDLLDEPLSMRLEAMRAIAPAQLCVPYLRAESMDEVRRFYAGALSRGHEGLMVKDLDSPYRFGGRGRAWQKVKESRTVDLAVLAAEWGSGRRTGFLSNLHLGARRSDGTFCMVGKTFKGLTDDMLRWQTTRLEELAIERTPRWVRVEPALVVEIRFNEVQRSPRYPGGIALRFARVVRHRPDKPSSDVEPLEALVAKLGVAMVNAASKRTQAGKDPWATKAAAPEEEQAPDEPQLSLFDD